MGGGGEATDLSVCFVVSKMWDMTVAVFSGLNELRWDGVPSTEWDPTIFCND